MNSSENSELNAYDPLGALYQRRRSSLLEAEVENSAQVSIASEFSLHVVLERSLFLTHVYFTDMIQIVV
jgi:hypothetical protein